MPVGMPGRHGIIRSSSSVGSSPSSLPPMRFREPPSAQMSTAAKEAALQLLRPPPPPAAAAEEANPYAMFTGSDVDDSAQGSIGATPNGGLKPLPEKVLTVAGQPQRLSQLCCCASSMFRPTGVKQIFMRWPHLWRSARVWTECMLGETLSVFRLI